MPVAALYDIFLSKKYWGSVLVSGALFMGCKPRCYDCIVTDADTMEKDTINYICTDDPQYTSSYLQSWKVACQIAGGETVLREAE